MFILFLISLTFAQNFTLKGAKTGGYWDNYIFASPLGLDFIYVIPYGQCTAIYDVLCATSLGCDELAIYVKVTVDKSTDTWSAGFYTDSVCTINPSESYANIIQPMIPQYVVGFSEEYIERAYDVKIKIGCGYYNVATQYAKLGTYYVNGKTISITEKTMGAVNGVPIIGYTFSRGTSTVSFNEGTCHGTDSWRFDKLSGETFDTDCGNSAYFDYADKLACDCNKDNEVFDSYTKTCSTPQCGNGAQFSDYWKECICDDTSKVYFNDNCITQDEKCKYQYGQDYYYDSSANDCKQQVDCGMGDWVNGRCNCYNRYKEYNNYCYSNEDYCKLMYGQNYTYVYESDSCKDASACGSNSIWNGVECVCVSGFQYYNGDCISNEIYCTKKYGSGYIWDNIYATCTKGENCPTGTYWDSEAHFCMCKDGKLTSEDRNGNVICFDTYDENCDYFIPNSVYSFTEETCKCPYGYESEYQRISGYNVLIACIGDGAGSILILLVMVLVLLI